MQISWAAINISVAVVLFEGILSFFEETFWFSQKVGERIKLPFLMHGGVVVGDLIIFSYLFGIWIPQLVVPWWLWIVFFPVSLVITWYCHKGWWFACEFQPGFMYPNRDASRGDPELWHRDLPYSAWVHFVFMTAAIMFIGAYIYSPMPVEVVKRTALLMIIFVPVAIVEPGIVQAWPPTKKDLGNSAIITWALWALIVLVTWAKTLHWLGI